MRTSLALVLAATLLACSSGDDPAPPADQTAAIVSPATPTPAAPSTTESATTTTPAPAAAEPATDAKADDPATADTPAADSAAFADLAQKLNDCLAECKDAACGGSCLSEFQAGLPATPAVGGGSAMCCHGDAFFVCHSADAETSTCDPNADTPGPNCQAVTAMDIICKQKNGDD